MDKRDLIKKLSSFHGVSGHEYMFSNEIEKIFLRVCDEVKKDNLGNIIGVMKSSKPDAKRVMLEAHIDEIGMMITEIDERGFLRFTNIGGIDSRILPGKEVVIHGKKDLLGIIGNKPPHITSPEERSNAIPMDKLYIDTGYGKDEILNLVAVGDTVTFQDGFAELGEDYISAKSQDDRTSLAVLIFVMEKLKGEELPFDLYFCACVQEEVGRRGAASAATAIDPVFAVAIDVCHAATPDALKGTIKPESGAVVSKGPNIHPLLCEHAIKILDENNISYVIDVDSDDTGTDAWAIQIAKEGIPTLLFSLPLKYMHTMVETVNIKDVETTTEAILALIKNTKDAEAILCWK